MDIFHWWVVVGGGIFCVVGMGGGEWNGWGLSLVLV